MINDQYIVGDVRRGVGPLGSKPDRGIAKVFTDGIINGEGDHSECPFASILSDLGEFEHNTSCCRRIPKEVIERVFGEAG